MKKYRVCVVSKEYRWVDIEATTELDAETKALDDIDNIMNYKPGDYETDIYVEGESE